MDSIQITLATMLIGKVLDEMAFRYGGDKFKSLKKYPGLLGLILKLRGK